MLDSLHNSIHDILLLNVGQNNIEAPKVEITSDQVELDGYWTLKGTNYLPAFDFGNVSENDRIIPNGAKIRLRTKAGVTSGTEITGTLLIKSGDRVLVNMTLTGLAGDPSIVSESIPDAVLYVPYGSMIQDNNTAAQLSDCIHIMADIENGPAFFL